MTFWPKAPPFSRIALAQYSPDFPHFIQGKYYRIRHPNGEIIEGYLSDGVRFMGHHVRCFESLREAAEAWAGHSMTSEEIKKGYPIGQPFVLMLLIAKPEFYQNP